MNLSILTFPHRLFTVGKRTILTFLATPDVKPGTLGRINTPNTHCTTTFICRNWNELSVDRNTGEIKLTHLYFRYRHYNLNELRLDVRVSTKCVYSISHDFVTVNLIVLPEKFGDSFLSSSIRKLGRLVKENEKYNTGRGMAGSLHRMMRMVEKEKNPEAFNEMMASARVDAALQEAVKSIKDRFITNPSGDYFKH